MNLSNYEELKDTENGDRSTLFPCLVSAVCFALIGAYISWWTYTFVGAILTVTTYAFILWVVFILMGLIVIFISWRISQNKMRLLFYGLVVVVNGVICFMIAEDWFVEFSAFTRIVLYSMIIAQILFTQAIPLRLLANSLAQMYQKREFIDTAQQHNLILYSSIFLGVILGMLFGLTDIDDAAEFNEHLKVMSKNRYCIPLGFFAGGICGFFNEKIRQNGFEYSDKLNQQLRLNFRSEIYKGMKFVAKTERYYLIQGFAVNDITGSLLRARIPFR